MNRRVHQIFGERISRWSERTALDMGDHRVNYGELDRLSNRLARRLIQEGVQRGDIVAIAAGDIEHFAIAMLAILKTGAAYLAIDTRYPVERVRDILADARPRVLLAVADFSEELIPVGLPAIRDFTAGNVLDACSDQPVEVAGSADDAAYICYTSGSTGRPKGIEIAHRGIPILVGDINFVPFGPDDRVGQASNFAFDATTFEVWGALLNGGCIVHVPTDVLFSASALAEFLELERVSIIWLTTSLFNALSAGRPDAFGALNVLIIGGEAADPIPVGRVLRSGRPPRRLLNGYGPTEATTFAIWHEVTLEDIGAGRVPIGKPIRSMEAYILDERMRPVGRGEPGELFVGGPGLANGYLNRPGLTSERFVSNPLHGGSADRLYRTGDLCRELPDGNIDYLGRIDDQVKIRGFRVEPFEVAATLRRLAGVEDAVVLARNAPFGTKELIAFVRGDKLDSVERLRQEIAGLLPDYMVPSIIRSIDKFPLTANGKLDRAALLGKIQSGDLSSRQPEPVDDIERRVAAIWKNVLRRDDIGLNEDFRSLGGDSLSLMNLALEIESAFGTVLSVDDLQSPLTVLRLAGQLRGRLGIIKSGDGSRPLSEHKAQFKVFAVSPAWIMGGMPEEIGQALSPDRRWHHVQVPFTFFRNANKVTIEEMAIHVERLIYSMSPEGPYVLYGHCITGLLAYEVAQRLLGAGQWVSILVLVDSYPAFPRTWNRWARSLPRRLARFARLEFKSQMDRLRRKITSTRTTNYEDFIREACIRAANEYRPTPYSGRVIFFRPSFFHSLFEKDLTAWRRLVQGGYTEHVVEFHDQGQVTAHSVQSGYNEIAARLKEMSLSQQTRQHDHRTTDY